jgi:serine/threonine protein kinase/tetratricopeptide (TPR) repeat protein
MNAKRWQQIEQLYHAALERGVQERAAFLTDACAGDETLRREVESLLAHEGQAKNFMESPALDLAAKMLAHEQSATVAVGQMVHQYKITRPLGAGGMGEVYLADDTRLQRKVALKFLSTHFTKDRKHLSRFQQEARAVAALSHPNVCTIHEVIETEDGRHCIVMEYVEGVTLRERIAEGRMNVREALDVVIQVASALASAHTARIVHRDIKLDNIMLRRDGYVKILDFGLAKLTEQEVSINTEAPTKTLINTTPGVVMGTVFYMSPEQARGLPVDARTDLWSLGVVLYELVTGRKPFDGATPTDEIISIAEREPELLVNFVPEAPAQLEQIVKKTLAKERDQRYQSADSLLTDLRNLRQDLQIGAEVKRFKSTASNTSTGTIYNRTASRIAVFASVIAIVIIGLFLFSNRSTPAPNTEIKSLAVLPLENLSGDTSQDYFAEGMTDSLISDLARIGALRVISRPSVMRYKGTRKPPAEIGRELNVDAVLIGSVERTGARVRMAVQLIHAATERNLWTNSYNENLGDVLALQRSLTQDIVDKIKIQPTTQEQVRLRGARPVNPDAYDHFLRGQYYLHRQSQEDNEAAITALEQAVAADDMFAEAFAALAQAYVWKLFLFAPNEKQWSEKAFVAAEKALKLDPNLAVAYLARGRLLWTPANRFPHEKAIREYRRALTLDPNLDEARNQLALVYCHIGAFDEAIQESQNAIATNPNNNLAQFRIAETLNFQGKHEQALAALRAIPKEANPALVGQQTAWALFNLGRKEEASAAIDQFLKDYPQDNRGLFTGLQAILAASSGQRRAAEENIKLAVEKGKGFGHFHHTAYYIAGAYALMKNPVEAVKWLEEAAGDGFPCYPLFERDPNLNNLRQDARFITFLAKQKQQWEYYKGILLKRADIGSGHKKGRKHPTSVPSYSLHHLATY